MLFFLAQCRRVIIIIISSENRREQIGDGLPLRIAHGIQGDIHAFGQQLVLQPVAPAVAANDAPCFPRQQVVKELTAADANLANEYLVEVVGGQAFFLRPFLPVGFSFFSFGSPAGSV